MAKFGTCGGCGTVTQDIHSRCSVCSTWVTPGVDWGKRDAERVSSLAPQAGGVESDRGRTRVSGVS